MAQSAISGFRGPQGIAGSVGQTNPALIFDYAGDNFEIPNNADWAINAPAAIIADPTNNAFNVAAMDDTAEEGVGGTFYVPTNATRLVLNFVHRAAANQTGAQTVDYRFRFREITDNGAIGSWTIVDMTEMTIPNADTNFHYETVNLLLSTISMTAGAYHQFELTRYTTTAGGSDTVTGDMYLKQFRLTTYWNTIKWYPADVLRSATNADWSINANAAIATDSNNAGLTVRLFDDTAEEGAGIGMNVPEAAENLRLWIISRGENGTSGNVEVTLHYREAPDNGAVGAWAQEDMASVVAIPANENWQYDNWDLDLSALTTAITPGSQYLFQITRNTIGTDTLAGDWAVLAIGFEYY